MYDRMRWGFVVLVIALQGATSVLGDQPGSSGADSIALQASAQFRGARPLKGTLVNLGAIDTLVAGTKLSIPLIIVKQVEFSSEGDCYVTLVNDSRIKGDVLNHQFKMVTDWGEVRLMRSKLTVLTLTLPPPIETEPKGANNPESAAVDDAALQRELESTTWQQRLIPTS